MNKALRVSRESKVFKEYKEREAHRVNKDFKVSKVKQPQFRLSIP